jgi:hypothetical protein
MEQRHVRSFDFGLKMIGRDEIRQARCRNNTDAQKKQNNRYRAL